jgi:acyl-homoserine-lactone acylase
MAITQRFGCAAFTALVGATAFGAIVSPWVTATAADPAVLAKQVQIRRTQFGVPHIEGETLEAAAFGFAYCQAEDHLDNILRGILGVRSQLAATFGPGDNDKNVTADFFNYQFRVYPRAVETYHKLDPDYRAMLEGFAAGLNFYVARHHDQAPAWAPIVTGHDLAAYGIAGVMRFAFNRNDILKDFLKSQGVKTAQQDDGVDDSVIGSNMWAFAPTRSQSGHAMLMGNPHQHWQPVSTYYEAHMIVPGRMNFYGSTFIGRPILTSGWNEHLGWSHTVNAPDLEEIYELDLDPAAADHYLFDGGSVPLKRDDVKVVVKDSDNNSTQQRTFWHSPIGPVVLRTPTKIYVLRNASYDNYRAYEQWLRMSQATNLDEFRKTVEMNLLPMFNICYADSVGNIFYIWNGTVPNLPHPAHKATAVHATRTSDIWTKFHSTDELPQLLNPLGGYVQNCNSPPYLTNLQALLDPARYPAHFSPNDLSLRTQHSLRLVNNDKKLSLEDVCTLKHSPLMLLAERVKDDLIAALRSEPSTPQLAAAIQALESWNNTVAAASRGGTLFANWWERYYEKGVGKFAVPWNAAEPMTTPRGLADRERALSKFHAALADINALYGRPDVTWGEVHRIRKGSVDLPVSGGPGLMGCFRVLEFKADHDGKLAANSGDSFVFAVEFSQPPRAFTNVAYSQSDVPTSPHFNDQASLFSENRLKPAAFTDAEITAQLLKTYRPGEE